jgi:cation transport ATPase
MNNLNSNNNLLEELISSIKDYLSMKVDDTKLHLAESFSILFSKLIFFVIAIVIGGLAVGFLATAFNSWLEVLLNSRIYASLVTSGIFILSIVVLFFLRKRLFTNNMVRLFIKLFFEKPNNEK